MHIVIHWILDIYRLIVMSRGYPSLQWFSNDKQWYSDVLSNFDIHQYKKSFKNKYPPIILTVISVNVMCLDWGLIFIRILNMWAAHHGSTPSTYRGSVSDELRGSGLRKSGRLCETNETTFLRTRVVILKGRWLDCLAADAHTWFSFHGSPTHLSSILKTLIHRFSVCDPLSTSL